MSSDSFLNDNGPKKSPMQSASSNGPCLFWIANILSNSGAIEPIAEPVTSLMPIRDLKRVHAPSSYILIAGGVEVMIPRSEGSRLDKDKARHVTVVVVRRKNNVELLI